MSAPPTTTPSPLLSVQDVRVTFRTASGVVPAVDGVSFDVAEHEVVGIVGESGSGKTVTALSILGLLPPSASVRGEVLFRGENLLGRADNQLRSWRGSRIAMVFQDAMAALNPLHRVGKQVAEAIRVHDPGVGRREAHDRAVELLRLVGIPNPEVRVEDYPHQFSGGMRQRVMIAIAMANNPDLLIADEPTTALDVTTQAQVLDVLGRARERTGSAMILITHDLGVVAGVADRVLVMYAGRVVEAGTVRDVFQRPQHPYTAALLGSLPRLDAGGERRLPRIPGQPPSLLDVPSGCAFRPRCPFARPEPCASAPPPMRSTSPPGHRVACYFAGELPARTAVACGAVTP